jgi:rhodanese-related sulfurtransferase
MTEWSIGNLVFGEHGAISPQELKEQIDAGTAPPILDVRSKKEFQAGHVRGAVHLPFWQVGRFWEMFAGMRDKPMVIYCGHGPRAHLAGAALMGRGFTRIVYLTGHMARWKEMKLPLEGK